MPVASTFGAVGGVAVDVSAADQVLPKTSRAFWIGGTGDLALVMDDGSEITLVGIPAGALLALQAGTVKNTGTSATNVVALF